MNNSELPLGFGLALAQNTEAMEKFSNLSEAQKQEIINGTHAITSKSEMREYVSKILSDY